MKLTQIFVVVITAVILTLQVVACTGVGQKESFRLRDYIFVIGDTTHIIFVPELVGLRCEQFAAYAKNAAAMRTTGISREDARVALTTYRNQGGTKAEVQPSFGERHAIFFAVEFAYDVPEGVLPDDVNAYGVFFCVSGGHQLIFKKKGIET